MRRFSAILLALLLASTTHAISIGFQVDSASTIAAGETIQINIMADSTCQGIYLGAVVEAASLNEDGQAQAITNMGGSVVGVEGLPLTWQALTADIEGYLDNYNGCLFDSSEGIGRAAEQSILASFSYTINPDWDGTAFYIAPLVSGIEYESSEGSFWTSEPAYGQFASGPQPISGVMIGTPEPITVALLGLGSLILYRKK